MEEEGTYSDVRLSVPKASDHKPCAKWEIDSSVHRYLIKNKLFKVGKTMSKKQCPNNYENPKKNNFETIKEHRQKQLRKNNLVLGSTHTTHKTHKKTKCQHLIINVMEKNEMTASHHEARNEIKQSPAQLNT